MAELPSVQMRLRVHSIFRTIQGEGKHAGRLAVFVRLAGCNVWSGDPKERGDTSRGVCAAWCDTEFRMTHKHGSGGVLTYDELTSRILELWGRDNPVRPFVVFTGGEPGLQLTNSSAWLWDTMASMGADVSIETNGRYKLSRIPLWVWRTLSPKPPIVPADDCYDEVKVVYPVEGLDPDKYYAYAQPGRHWIQPLDASVAVQVEQLGLVRRGFTSTCLEFVEKSGGRWRMGLQQHKVWGIP